MIHIPLIFHILIFDFPFFIAEYIYIYNFPFLKVSLNDKIIISPIIFITVSFLKYTTRWEAYRTMVCWDDYIAHKSCEIIEQPNNPS